MWKTAIDNAQRAWNETETPVSINYSKKGKVTLTAKQYSDSWYGLTSRKGNDKFTIKLNSKTITKDAEKFQNFVQSTLVHEYGHVFSLDHTSKVSIMNSSRNRNEMILPQQFDEDEVNSVYRD